MKILLLNQCFYPDLMATAQQLTSLAVGLRERGHEITVITGARGYDDPTKRFSKRENWSGIDIIRIPTLGLGKTTKLRRAIDFMSFLVFCTWKLLAARRFDCVVGLTSPPLISVLGALFVRLKGGDFFFWVMDLNPDEAIAAGWLKKDSFIARWLERMLRYSLRHSNRVIVLDRFMKQRIEAKGINSERIEVISPWSFDEVIKFDRVGREAFRAEHGLTDSFVVMHAGNHSPCHPLDTLLEAARELVAQQEIAFCFVGGGSEHLKVAEFARTHKLNNIRCLPYQPLNRLGAVLSAADFHVVVMGDAFVGIVHPSKVYNILAVGTPLLYVGPGESSIVDVAGKLQGKAPFFAAKHGEPKLVADHIRSAALKRPGRIKASEVDGRFSSHVLLPKFISLIEAKERSNEAEIPIEAHLIPDQGSNPVN